jgi:hypothetical protein
MQESTFNTKREVRAFQEGRRRKKKERERE